jgi:meiotically up-regulated gene 157 (Mug157) protein
MFLTRLRSIHISVCYVVPYLDPLAYGYNRTIYENTKRYILSSANRYFYSGRAAKGIGSPHTPDQNIWHMSLIIQALLAESQPEQNQLVSTIMETTTGNASGSCF